MDTLDVSTSMGESPPQLHERAFEEFARRAQKSLGDSIHEVILFGSTARGETHGIDSDVDIFVIIYAKKHEDELRDIAYDVQLEHGVVVSLHVLNKDRFDERRDHPFIQNVLNEGCVYG